MGGQGGGPRRARATITRNDALARTVRSRAFQRQHSRTCGGWSVLGNLSELSAAPARSRRDRCAAAQRSEFRACKRDPPPSPSHLQCVSVHGITEPTVRCVMYIHSFPTTSRTQERSRYTLRGRGRDTRTGVGARVRGECASTCVCVRVSQV